MRNNDLIFTNAKKALAPRLAAYPALQKSLLSIKNIVTAPYNESLVGSDTIGGVQTWCPQFSEFNSAALRSIYASRQVKSNTGRAYGENVWWYGCITPASPFPSYHTDANLINSRLLSWMQYDYGVEGNLYWDVCYYQKYQSSGQIIDRDVWTDANSYEDCCGDGQLLYPGSTYGLTKPISTLRLESIREGNEDYEYFYLFDQYVQSYNAAQGTSLKSVDLLQRYYQGLFTDMKPKNAPELFASQRASLLSMEAAVGALPPRKKKTWNKKSKDLLFVFLMLFLPTLQFALFWIVPNFNSLVLAFQLPSSASGQLSFVNFTRFWNELTEANSSLYYSIVDTLVYFLITTLVNLPIVTFLSYVLFKKVPFAKAFRVIFYLPAILGGTVTAAMYRYMIDLKEPYYLCTLTGYEHNFTATYEANIKVQR